METGQVVRGASLRRLSQYPTEAEALLPPLSHLELAGEPSIAWEGRFGSWLVPMRLNVNLKSRGLQPVHEAAYNGYAGCVEWLRDAGAGVEAVMNDGRQPIALQALI
eukprot:3096960-Rhodomonas_salina.2